MKESKTTYAYLIEHMHSPSFQKVWNIAYDFVHKLPGELCNELHEALNRGVDVLDSEPLLQMYMYAFGKMHNAKLQYAFNQMQDRIIKENQIEIIDYGCGQGLASICYHDFITEHNSLQKVTKITLIEPSPLALSRAELLCSCFYPDAEIIAINKSFDDLVAENINVSSKILTLHIFSNILDVESYNLQNLIQIVMSLKSGKNEYVIVSPIQNIGKTHQLKTFAYSISEYIYYENYLDKRQLNEKRDWTCAVLLCSDRTKQEIIVSDRDKVFEEAKSFTENKNNDREGKYCIELFHKLHVCAEFGDKRCQNLLGVWYLRGIGTEQNNQFAFEWFQKAAEQDCTFAFLNIGDFYQKGIYVGVDHRKAVQYYKEGAVRNHYGCQYRLGECYLKGKGVNVDKNMAFSLFMESSLQGCAPAMFMLYRCYLNGWGTEKDKSAAIKYLEDAANKEHAPSQEKLGEVYKYGLLEREKSPKKSFYWYLKAAEQGRASAQFNIGYFHANGYGVNKDEKLAFDWYSKAAEQNNVAALNNLAICYEYGRGTIVDLTKAAYYYEVSAKLGNITAQKNLAICYLSGTGVELNPSKAFYWTLEAAKNGDIDSTGKIALYYFKGYGTDKDHVEALLWYARYYSKNNHIYKENEAFSILQEKANEGDSQALYIIGKCLQYGVVTKKNIKDANTYFEKAAELGHIESMIKIHRISSLYNYCSISRDDESSYKDAYGVKYSKDKKILIDSGCQKREKYQIAKGTRIICANAFSHSDIGKIIIPSSVIVIGKNPFAKSDWSRCSVKNIECHSAQFVVSDFALYTKDKKKLISYFGNAPKVIIPDGVEIIGDNAFAEDENLKEIIFPESLCYIKYAAFKYCVNLRCISLPKNVREIGTQCFYGCESLEEVINLGEIEKICEETFCGCNIKKLSLPESLIEIEDNAFNSNRDLDDITFPANVKRIGNSSFAYCSVKHVYLNEKLEEIGDFCFLYCPIESITIPTNIKFIGLNPFVGTQTIECKDNCRYASENGLLYDKENGNLISHYSETEVALYPSISRIDSFAFYNSNVTDIFMGSNIVEVAPWAFYYAHKLEKVIWRKSKVVTIPMGCFGKCSKICKIDIPSCVEHIDKGAFWGCHDLRIIRFDGLDTKANEEMFCGIGKPFGIPYSYLPRNIWVNDSHEYIEREDDPDTFLFIEVIVPRGCVKNYFFLPIYDHGTVYYDCAMDRRFIIREDEKE